MYTRTRDSNPFAYTGYHDCKCICRVETWERAGWPPLIICTELPENHGTSITNMSERLAAQLVAAYFPSAFDDLEGVPFYFIERYPPGRFRTERRETLAFVTFAHRAPRVLGGMQHHGRPTLGTPLWRYVKRAELEALLGCPYPEPEQVDYWGRPRAHAATDRRLMVATHDDTMMVHLGRHVLTRQADAWHCTACLRTWARRPRSRCPGLPHYEWGAWPPHLVSRTELRRRGLVPVGSPSGCTYTGNLGWCPLYDAGQAQPRRAATAAQRDALARGRASQAAARRLREEAAQQEELAALEAEAREQEQMLADDKATACGWARDLLGFVAWCVLDVETTGLGDDAGVVALAVLAPGGEILLDTLVRPAGAIPPDATAIHGIMDADVAAAPAFAAVYPRLRAATAGRLLVAYNAEFDRAVVRRACDQSGLPWWKPRWSCAMEMYSMWVGEYSPYHGDYRLQPLPGGDHTPAGDCRATLALIRRLARTGTSRSDEMVGRDGD